MTNAKATTAKTVKPVRERKDGSLVFSTNSKAVERIVRPDGSVVFSVIGIVFGRPVGFPPDKPTGLNLKLRSKDKSDYTWWEVKGWKEAAIAIRGWGEWNGVKFPKRDEIGPGDKIKVTSPLDEKSPQKIDLGSGKFKMGPDGKTPITRISWVCNHATQIEILSRAKELDLSDYAYGNSGTKTKVVTVPTF